MAGTGSYEIGIVLDWREERRGRTMAKNERFEKIYTQGAMNVM